MVQWSFGRGMDALSASLLGDALPRGWSESARHAKLGDLVDFVQGKTPSTTELSYWGDGFPWVSPKDMYMDDGLTCLSYLGPLRSYPPRHMAFAVQDDTNWAAGGGRAWDQMRKSKSLRDEVNTWLGSKERLQTPCRLALQRFVAPTTARSAIRAGIDEILGNLKDRDEDSGDDAGQAETASLERFDRDAFIKLMTEKLLHDHDIEGDDDLVLVEAYGNENRLVAIEQPEIHLHPRLQAELGDVFIESALGERKNRFLLETHSEHLLLRIMRRMRETAEGRVEEGKYAVRPDDVMVLYVEPDGTRSIVRQMPLNERDLRRRRHRMLSRRGRG